MEICRSLAILLALMLMSYAVCDGEPSPPPASGIEGVITFSPNHPGPIRKGEAGEAPLAETSFVVTSAAGGVKSFSTDKQGRFRILLPPGHYTITRQERTSRIGSYGPFEIDVTAGNIAKVEWRCDSGMR